MVSRTTTSGRKHVVRYRLGGRAYPVQHGGSFQTLKEAKRRRDLIAGELASGRNPADLLHTMTKKPITRTFAQVAEAYRTSRVDIGDETRKNTISHIKKMIVFSDCDPAMIRPGDVREWIATLNLKPSSVRRYVGTLRAIFDFADIDPNPARDPKVKLPQEEPTIVEPPSARDVDAILAYSPPRWGLPLRTLEQTGMRVGELAALEWRDVDVDGSRFRIRHGKTRTARRWVAVPEWLMIDIAETTPPDDRTPERRVFVGFTVDATKNVMARACKAAGISHFHPHDLRHRYASIKIAEGVPVTQVAAQLGHAKKSMTLDTYSHVMIDELS
jgi:integrase